eukprot:3672185-Amphidinium_carterae.1
MQATQPRCYENQRLFVHWFCTELPSPSIRFLKIQCKFSGAAVHNYTPRPNGKRRQNIEDNVCLCGEKEDKLNALRLRALRAS